MSNENLREDNNGRNVSGAVTDDSNKYIKMLRIDDTTKGLKVNVVGGIPIVAGTDQEVQFNQLGALGASTHFKFDYTNQQLKIGGVATVLDGSAINPLTTGGLTNTYFATYVQNTSNGISASSDMTAGNNLDDGSLTGHYIDAGINSSGYADPTLTFAGANDGYYYVAGGNLAIGAATSGKVINFFTGGFAAANVGMSLNGGTLSLGLVNTTLGKLTLFGSTSGNVSIQPNAVAGSNIVLTAPASTGTIALTSQLTSGTVTSVSVVSANGFAGTVANPTTTPAITLTTSITGVLKGNGTAISAATAGTDYAVGSTGLSGGQTIAGSTLTNENLTLRANAADLTTGQVNITSSKEASNTTTGALAVAGGLAVAKRVYALDMTVTNTITGSISGNAATVTTNANLTGVITSSGNATSIASQTGTGTKFVVDTSPTLVTPNIGTPTAGVLTSCTGLPAASVVAGSLGTGAYVMDTKLTVPQVINTANSVTVSSNAGTVPITSKINNFTNSSASAMTITMATASAVDGQLSQVRIYDASAATKGITWVNTENSTVTAPTTSNGSTTLPLTVLFQFNGGTSLWRCIGSA